MNTAIWAAALILQSGTGLEADIEVALGTAGLTSRTATFDENLLRLFRQGEFTTPFYDACSENPWRIPFFAQTIRQELTAPVGRPSDSLNSGARLAGFGTRRALIGNPNAAEEAAAKKPGALKSALEGMVRQKQIVGKLPSLSGVPADVQEAAALVLGVLPRCLEFRKSGLRELGDLSAAYVLFSQPLSPGPTFDASIRGMRQVDTSNLVAGAHDLVLACQSASARLAAVSHTARFEFEVQTVWGWIRLTGGSKTLHAARPTLLVIDTGGDDTYVQAPTTMSAANWASVVIDTEGSDRYLGSAELGPTPVEKFAGRAGGGLKPGPGGALLGYSVLIDLKGNDLYRSNLPGQGSGRLGVGVLLDQAGDDVYDGYQDSQGFGLFGVGILEDLAGNDRYQGFSQVQGVGQTRGFGYLADREGKDEYLANDSVIDFPSVQSAQHNVSMSQGAGNGRRGDYIDGHSLAGGVGILYDGAGDDKYVCGVFGQGVGYWEGVGMLWDTGGTDSYLGQWYAQGTSAHFAIGFLEDESGNDTYTAPMNMAQGAGHDFSFGGLLDRAGDDRYKAPNLSLGAGNANGIGLLVDFGGNDTYESSGITLGRGAEAPKGSLRSRALCFGLFIDLGGQDTYPASATWAINAARLANWTDKGPTVAESQLGVFWDR